MSHHHPVLPTEYALERNIEAAQHEQHRDQQHNDSGSYKDKSIADVDVHRSVTANTSSIDPEEERRLVRFLDMRVLPCVVLAYFLTFLDRANIGNANSAGLSRDLGLQGYDYNIGGSLFYLFYFLVELPSGLLIKRFGTIIIPISVVSFGIVTLATTWIHNRASFFVIRVILGAAEGFAQPGIAYVLSRFYKRSEITVRIGVFMLGAAGISQAFGSLLAGGLIGLGTVGSVRGWRIIFLVEGIMTIGLGIMLLIVWPKDPEKTGMFNERQREIQLKRMLDDSEGATVVTEASTLKLIFRALKSPTSVVCCWIYICDNVVIQGLALFTPTILRTNYPGRTTVAINLLAAPIHIVGSVVALGMSYLATRYKRHFLVLLFGASCGVIGYAMWLGTSSADVNVRFGALYMIAIAGYTCGPTPFGWAMSNASTATIRAVTAAMIPGFGALGSIISPWTYVASTAPAYRPGNSVNVALQSSIILAATGLFLYQYRENKKRDAGKRDHRLDEPGVEDLGYLHPKFRFTY